MDKTQREILQKAQNLNDIPGVSKEELVFNDIETLENEEKRYNQWTCYLFRFNGEIFRIDGYIWRVSPMSQIKEYVDGLLNPDEEVEDIGGAQGYFTLYVNKKKNDEND